MEREFLKKKEESENKIKDINAYWKNLELTYQTELKRREEEYKKKKKEERKEIKKNE